MGKQSIIKWCKRIGITMLSIVGLFLLLVICCYGYEQYYIPKKIASLYKDAYHNIDKADAIALEIMSEYLYDYDDKKEKVLNILTNAAEKGNVPSMVLLGRYYKGYDMKGGNDIYWIKTDAVNLGKSFYWYFQAAKKGNAEAQGELGHDYKWGLGVKRNFVKAVYWLKHAADGGNSIAQFRLGHLYYNGLALYDVDIEHTDYWYQSKGVFISFLEGEVLCVKQTNRVCEVLKNPKIVFLKSDVNKAKHYWQLAAAQGQQEAKDALEKCMNEKEEDSVL